MTAEFRIGVVGDLHSFWDDADVAYFNRNPYELLFFVGDLGGGTASSSLRVAREISRLDTPALVMPGNHDTGDIGELAAELNHRRGISRLTAVRAGGDANAGAGSGARLCGYSLHRMSRDGLDFTVVAARPHSLGGPELSYPDLMASAYGVHSMDESSRRLCALVDAAPSRDLVFLGHNGPAGLGARPTDMWGCDFKPGGGDWGDPDLAFALEHARQTGKRILAVVGGHMHLRTRTGEWRPWRCRKDGVLFLNISRVPRIFSANGRTERHHVALTIGPDGAGARERYIDAA